MIKKSALVSAVLAMFLLTVGLTSMGSSKEKKGTEPFVANFSYTPDSRKAPGSGGVTFTVAGATYVTGASNPWPLAPQFAKLNDAFKEDLSKILVAKGFNFRGPFDSYDLIPYSDKKQVDLYLVPTLELSTTFKDPTVETVGGTFSKREYHGTGTIDVSGKLTVKLQEIMTREPMWTKNIPMSYTIHYDVRFPFFTGAPRPFDINLVMDDLAKGLEQQYPKMLETFSNMLDSEEMRVIKKQAQGLKKTKGY